MTAAPTKRTTLPTLQTAITKTRAQHAASPPLHCPWQEGRPACTTACTTANGRRRKPLLNEALHGMHAAIGH